MSAPRQPDVGRRVKHWRHGDGVVVERNGREMTIEWYEGSRTVVRGRYDKACIRLAREPKPQRSTQEQMAAARARYAQLRVDWFAANGPCARCGSWKDLELDHVDPGQKVSHRVFSWGKAKCGAELSKCQALCHVCHANKTGDENMARRRPRPSSSRCGGRGHYATTCTAPDQFEALAAPRPVLAPPLVRDGESLAGGGCGVVVGGGGR